VIIRAQSWSISGAARSLALTPTKLLPGQMLIAFAVIVPGVWEATQWAAVESQMSVPYPRDAEFRRHLARVYV